MRKTKKQKEFEELIVKTVMDNINLVIIHPQMVGEMKNYAYSAAKKAIKEHNDFNSQKKTSKILDFFFGK
jgi:hypothetical protein